MKCWLFLVYLAEKTHSSAQQMEGRLPCCAPMSPCFANKQNTEADTFLTSNHNTFLLFREVDDAGDTIVHEFGWYFVKDTSSGVEQDHT